MVIHKISGEIELVESTVEWKLETGYDGALLLMASVGGGHWWYVISITPDGTFYRSGCVSIPGLQVNEDGQILEQGDELLQRK